MFNLTSFKKNKYLSIPFFGKSKFEREREYCRRTQISETMQWLVESARNLEVSAKQEKFGGPNGWIYLFKE